MANMPHMHRREGDEVYCPRCRRRWAANEAPPAEACIDTAGDDRERRARAFKRRQELRNNPDAVGLDIDAIAFPYKPQLGGPW